MVSKLEYYSEIKLYKYSKIKIYARPLTVGIGNTSPFELDTKVP